MKRWSAVAARAVREHEAMQKPTELAALLTLLAPRNIKNVVEIGGMHGGTMWAWSHIATGKLVCVDLQVLSGRMEFAPECHTIVADSQLPKTRRKVERALDGESADFIFIDGDHSYDAVVADLKNWYSLLSADGVIAFHDICHRRMWGYDMWRFWQEASQAHLAYAIYDPEEKWGGIGVLAASPFSHLGIQDIMPPFCCRAPLLATPPQCKPWRCLSCTNVLDVDEKDLCHDCAAPAAA